MRMARESKATTVWEGSHDKGRGSTTTESGTRSEVDVTRPAGGEPTSDTTSPEELLAAAHAACYRVGLSHELDGAGHSPGRLETAVTVSFVPGEGIKSSRIEVSGRVEGIDQDGFV